MIAASYWLEYSDQGESMRVFFRQLSRGLLLVALSGALVACGDDDTSDVDAGSADAGAEVAPVTHEDRARDRLADRVVQMEIFQDLHDPRARH
jgi:hypothetical protein